MFKNISVYISAYLEKAEEYAALLSLIPENIEINIINDNPKFDIPTIKNNKYNKGKFQTIISALAIDEKKFAIVIDPDDILLGNLEWEKLFQIDKEIETNLNSDIIINSYFIRKNENKKFKYIKTPKFIFNPCTLYNIKKIQENSRILEEEFYINYMEDLCLLLLALHKTWKISYIDIPFYKYNYINGISTKSIKKFRQDLINAVKIEKRYPLKLRNITLCYIKLMRVNRLQRLYKKYGK